MIKGNQKAPVAKTGHQYCGKTGHSPQNVAKLHEGSVKDSVSHPNYLPFLEG